MAASPKGKGEKRITAAREENLTSGGSFGKTVACGDGELVQKTNRRAWRHGTATTEVGKGHKAKMPFWSGEKLEERLPHLVDPFDLKAIDCAAYTLRVGHEVYISPDREIAEPSRHTKRTLGQGEGFTIPSGQFGFLTTAERVSVPDDSLAFISIKARLKFSGLINISGFHVDPGYEGALLFSVMNAGPKPLHLEQGQPLFLIWYADLDRITAKKKQPKGGFNGIDTDQINKISGEILSLQSLSDKQRALEQDIGRQLEAQNSKISNYTLLVNVFLAAAIATGLIVWGMTEWIGSAPPSP